jgi:hypothetical protein
MNFLDDPEVSKQGQGGIDGGPTRHREVAGDRSAQLARRPVAAVLRQMADDDTPLGR